MIPWIGDGFRETYAQPQIGQGPCDHRAPAKEVFTLLFSMPAEVAWAIRGEGSRQSSSEPTVIGVANRVREEVGGEECQGDRMPATPAPLSRVNAAPA